MVGCRLSALGSVARTTLFNIKPCPGAWNASERHWCFTCQPRLQMTNQALVDSCVLGMTRSLPDTFVKVKF